MNRVVGITDQARNQLEAAFCWWKENRSEAQAVKWYNQFVEAIGTITNSPEKYPLSLENNSFPYEIRELRFGVGRRKTHRAVFTIRPEMVLVIAVRHLAQQPISLDDV
ncbi:MAG: type II toxin-antitoxin system RelE/ParE family toxin [Pirellulaceae bacterium]